MKLISKTKFLALFVFMMTMLCTTSVFAAGEYVTVNGVKLYNGFCYKNGDSESSLTGTADDFNAKYTSSTGLLELNNYNGGTIAVNASSDQTTTIKLTGDNVINSTGYGIYALNGGNICITSDNESTLTINVNGATDSNDIVSAIRAHNPSIPDGNVTLKGKAAISITVVSNSTDGFAAANGIYAANKISILENADLSIKCKNKANGSTNNIGLFTDNGSSQKIIFDTTGNISVDASESNEYSFAIRSSNYEMTKANLVTLKWNPGVGNSGGKLYGGDGAFDALKWAINIDNTNHVATYKYGTPYTVNVYGGYTDMKEGKYIEGDTVTIQASGATTDITFQKWTSEDVSISNSTNATTTFTMPNKDVNVIAYYNIFEQEPSFTLTTPNSEGTLIYRLKVQPTMATWKKIDGSEVKNFSTGIEGNETIGTFSTPEGKYYIEFRINGIIYRSEPIDISYTEIVEGFDVTDVDFGTLEYGYTSVTPQNISIYNRGRNALTINSVTVDGTAFEIEGTGTPEVAAGDTNTTFKVKPKSNLSTGTHTATITVTDTNNNEYTATVSVVASNVKDNTVYVSNEAELKAALTKLSDVSDTVDTVKLTSDIACADSYIQFTINKDATLDLAGNELSFVQDGLNIKSGNNVAPSGVDKFEFNIISSVAGGKISINNGNSGVFPVQIGSSSYDKQLLLKITGVELNGSDQSSCIIYNSSTKNVDLQISNSTLKGFGLLGHNGNDFANVKLSDVTLTRRGNNNLHLFLYSTFYATTKNIGDLLVDNQEIFVKKSNGEFVQVTATTDSAKTNLSEKYVDSAYDASLIIRTAEGFNVEDVTLDDLTYGYETADIISKTINITNRGTNALQITAVTVPNDSDFIVTGTTQPTVNAGLINTDFTIKAKENLNAGEHTATITVSANNGETYTAEVSVTVNPKAISPSISPITTSKTYTGSPIELNETELKVKYSDIVLTKGTDYEVAYDNNISVGNASIMITAKAGGNYTWTGGRTAQFIIEPMPVTPSITTTIGNQTYTGSPIKPEIALSDARLVVNRDYTVTYNNNQYVGTATATINPGTYSNYTFAAVSKNFNITPADSVLTGNHTNMNDRDNTPLRIRINNEELDLADNFVTLSTPLGCQSEITFTVEEFNGTGATITNNTKLRATAEGTLKVNAAFAGKDMNNDGTNEYNPTNYPIFIKAINKTQVTLGGYNEQDVQFTGNPVELQGTLTCSEDSLNTNDFVYSYEGRDGTTYVASSTAPTNVGKYMMTVKVKDTNATYTGSLTVNFTITPMKVTPSIAEITAVTYDGNAKEPIVTVSTTEGKALALNTDYTVEYSNNTNAGTNTATAKLVRVSASNYTWTGEVTRNFTINPMSVTPSIAEITAVTYDGNAKEPIVTVSTTEGKALALNTDYTVEYLNNTNAGTATAKLVRVSTSNYTWDGEVTKEFTISPMTVTLSVGELTELITYDGNAKTPTVTVSTNEGKTLEINKDYTFDYSDNINAGTATATLKIVPVVGSNYTFEEFEGKFGIMKATPGITIGNLSQKSNSVTAVTYEITPAVTNGTVKVEYKVEDADDSTYTETLPTVAGKYIVRVSLTGDNNLSDKTVTATLEITKKSTSSGGGGSSSATTKYEIKVTAGKGGSISPETTKVEKGEDETFRIKADEGYEIEDVLVDGKSVGAVSRYTFENVKAKHTIKATFKKVEEEIIVDPIEDEKWENPYVDIKSEDWYYGAVEFVNSKGLFKGISENEFGPKVVMTRGMFVTVLSRLAEDTIEGTATFDDVNENEYYAKPVAWAASKGIVNGVGDNKFAPNKEITRQEMAVMLNNYMKAYSISKPSTMQILPEFDDANEIAEWAKEALDTMRYAGIINGKDNNKVDPKGLATRAEVAQMIMNFCK